MQNMWQNANKCNMHSLAITGIVMNKWMGEPITSYQSIWYKYNVIPDTACLHGALSSHLYMPCVCGCLSVCVPCTRKWVWSKGLKRHLVVMQHCTPTPSAGCWRDGLKLYPENSQLHMKQFYVQTLALRESVGQRNEMKWKKKLLFDWLAVG